MFLLTVASVIVLLQNVNGGYNYQRPGLQLPNSISGSGGQNFAGLLNEYQNLEEKKTSYDFFQPHTNVENGNYFPNSFNTFNYQNDIFNRFNSKPNSVYGLPKIDQKPQQQVPIAEFLQHSGPQEFNVKNVQQTPHRFVPNFMNANHNVPSHLNLQNSFNANFGTQLSEHFRKQPLFLNPQSIPNILDTYDQNIQPVAPVLNLQNDFSSQKTYTPEVKVDNPLLKTQSNLAQPIAGQNTVPPVVTKHIYFHVPPPDIEETSVKPTLPKKSYKIIFIKVPSQESRNIEELQAAYNRLGPIEDKTLIYVLSNNSEDSQLVPAYKPSEHEVLFVKYNGNQSIGSHDSPIEQDGYKRK